MSHRFALALAALTVLATTVSASAAEAQLGAKECGVVRYRAFKIRTLKYSVATSCPMARATARAAAKHDMQRHMRVRSPVTHKTYRMTRHNHYVQGPGDFAIYTGRGANRSVIRVVLYRTFR